MLDDTYVTLGNDSRVTVSEYARLQLSGLPAVDDIRLETMDQKDINSNRRAMIIITLIALVVSAGGYVISPWFTLALAAVTVTGSLFNIRHQREFQDTIRMNRYLLRYENELEDAVQQLREVTEAGTDVAAVIRREVRCRR